jgi:hypothetical protein
LVCLDILKQESEEALLDHFTEGSVEAEVVEVLVLRLPLIPLLALLFEGLISLFQCIQVNIYRQVPVHSRIFRS